MKKKGIWKKIVSYILTTAMLVSIFAGVDMGWNVMEAQAGYSVLEAGETAVIKGRGYNLDWNATVKLGGILKLDEGGQSAYILIRNENNKRVGTIAGTVGSTWTNNYCDLIYRDWQNHSSNPNIRNFYFDVSHPGRTTATCETASVCTQCGAVLQNALKHNYTNVTTSGLDIVAKCSRSGCDSTVTYTLNPGACNDEIAYGDKDNYTGASVTVDPSSIPANVNSLPAASSVSIKYEGTTDDGDAYNSSTKPSEPGTYSVSITVSGKTVSSPFTISPGGDIYRFNKGTGEAGSMSEQLVLESEWNSDSKLKANEFSKTGYSFEKWTSDKGDFADEANVRHPDLENPWKLTLTAQWKPNDYEVTFDVNGADVSDGTTSATVTYDATPADITIPEKNCSDFKGYFTEAGTQIFDEDGKAVSTWTIPNNTTLYAHWDINHEWGYEAVDNEVIATCQNPVCQFSQKMTLTAPDTVYDKAAYDEADVTNEDEFPDKKETSNIEYEGTTAAGDAYSKSSIAPTNAGTYTATVTVTVGGTDYVAKKDFEIDKATQDNAAVAYLEYTWGETDPVPKPTISGVEEEATVKYYYNLIKSNVVGGEDWDGLTNETLDAGTFYVYAELGETSNYKAGKTPAREFKVIGQEVADGVIETTPYGEVYDKEPHSIELTINDSKPEDYTVTYSTSEEGTYSATKPEFTDAGSYTVYYKVKKFGFEVAKGLDTVDIAQKNITISGVNAKDKVYDGNTTATFDYSGVIYDGIIDGDTLSVEATGTFDTENVGVGKTVTITGYTLGGVDSHNYKLAESGHQSEATAKITQREVTLDWDNSSFDYNGSEQKPAATAGNLVGTDTCDVTVELVGVTESIDAGNYTIKAIELSNNNYKLPANVTKAFTINKIDQSGTLTMTGYTYNGTVSVPTVEGYEEEPAIKYYYSLEDKKTGGILWNNIGPKTLEPDTYYMYAVLSTTTNYKAYTTDTVAFTVEGADMSAEVNADDNTVTYTGTKVHGITVTAPKGAKIMYGTEEGSYKLSTCPTYKNVGEYTVYYKVTKTGCNPVKGFAKVIINKASLIVTPKSGQTKVYGDEDPVFTYTVSQLKTGDTASVVSGTLKRVAGEDVTDEGYELSMNDDMTAANYDITCTEGVKFMITPRDITADMVTLSQWKFDTTPADVTGYITVKYGDAVLAEGTDYELSGTTSASAKGTYTVTFTGKGNFKGSVNKEWKITDAIVSDISATSPITITYGEVPSITITGALPGDTITYGKSMDTITDSAVDYKNAGTYTVYYKVAREGYEPFESSVQLVIEPKVVSINWGNTDLVYNGKTQAPTATVSGLLGTDTCQAVISSDAKNVGTGYTATAASLSNTNYKLPEPLPTKSFSIKAKPITVKAKNASKYSGESDPKLGYDAQGLCAGDTLSGVTLKRASGEKVGTYTITVTVDASANPNYDITTKNGTFTINNRQSNQEEPAGDDSGSPSDSTPSSPSEPTAPVIPPVNKETPTEETPKLELPVIIKDDDTKKEDDEKLFPPLVEEKEDAGTDNGNIHLYIEVHEDAPIEEARIETSVNDLVKESNIFTEGEIEAIESGMDARIWTTVHEMDMSLVTEEEQDKILSAAIQAEGDDVNLMYFDINMFKQIGDGEIINIREPGTHIEITIDLPESVINRDENTLREYKIIRLHDGEVTVLDTVYNDAEKTLTFATDKFSTYVLAFVDTVQVKAADDTVAQDKEVISPITETETGTAGRSFVWLWWLLIIALLCMVGGYIVYRKNASAEIKK